MALIVNYSVSESDAFLSRICIQLYIYSKNDFELTSENLTAFKFENLTWIKFSWKKKKKNCATKLQNYAITENSVKKTYK